MNYKKLLCSEEYIEQQIERIAQEVIERYVSFDPLFVCLMRGGVPFASKLMFAITKQNPDFHPELDYLTVSTYGNARKGSEPRIIKDLDPRTTVKERPVVLLDDVFDKGMTAQIAKEHLLDLGASSVDFVVLVSKNHPRAERVTIAPWLIGADTPSVWLTGMGMDDTGIAKEGNRWLSLVAEADDDEATTK